MKNRNRNKGFTLIELLLVIALVVVITSVVVISYSSISKKEKEKNYDVMLANIETAAELYLEKNTSTAEILRNNGYMSITIQELVNNGLLTDYYTIDPKTNELITDLCINVLVGENLKELNFSKPNLCGSYLAMTSLYLYESDVTNNELDSILFKPKIVAVNKDGMSLTNENTTIAGFKSNEIKYVKIDDSESFNKNTLKVRENPYTVEYEYDDKLFTRKVYVLKDPYCEVTDANGVKKEIKENDKLLLETPDPDDILVGKVFKGWKVNIGGNETVIPYDGVLKKGTPKSEISTELINGSKYECTFGTKIQVAASSLPGYTINNVLSDSEDIIAEYKSTNNLTKTYDINNLEIDNLTLTASATPNTYKITYNGNGGTASVGSKTVTFGTSYGALATATRTGYTFIGWFTEANGGTQITATTAVNIASNQTLYAHWTVNSYTITVNKGTGISSVSGGGTYTYGTSITISASVSTGYTFDKWSNNITTLSQKITVTGSAVYTANASVNKYTVTYNGNGGSPSTGSKSVTYGSTYGTLASATRTGYTFVGWFTAASGGTQVTASTAVSITSNQTLYAHWTANSYTITVNRGTGISSVSGGGTYTYGTSVTIRAYPATNYAFSYWSNSVYSSSQTITVTGNATYTAYATYVQPVSLACSIMCYNASGMVFDSSQTGQPVCWVGHPSGASCTYNENYLYEYNNYSGVTCYYKARSICYDQNTGRVLCSSTTQMLTGC